MLYDPAELLAYAERHVAGLAYHHGRRLAREDGAEWLVNRLAECATGLPALNAVWEHRTGNPAPLRRHEAACRAVEADGRLAVFFLLEGDRDNARIAIARAYDAGMASRVPTEPLAAD